MSLSEIYTSAAAATGKTEVQLRLMAEQVFASILKHGMDRPDDVIWTAVTMKPFSVEVDFPRKAKTLSLS